MIVPDSMVGSWWRSIIGGMKKTSTTTGQIAGLIRRKMYTLAEELALSALETLPNDVELLMMLSHLYYEGQDYLSSARAMELVLRAAPNEPEFLQKAALSYATAGITDRGLDLAKQALSLSQNSPQSWQLIANIYEKTGRIEEGKEALSRVPDVDAFYEANTSTEGKLLYAEKRYGEAIDLIKKYHQWAQQGAKGGDVAENKMYIDSWFNLVKIYNKIGEYDLAWETAVHAHDISNQKWEAKNVKPKLELIKEIFSAENLRALAHSTAPFEQPVFIVGNARSGTSLLEQILSMHPDVGNGGELMVSGSIQRKMQSATDSFHRYPQCVFDMRVEDANAFAAEYRDAIEWFSVGKKRVTNKAIGLQRQVGFLSLFLPQSRAIMLHRHPLDNCVSCFTSNLVRTGHAYTRTIQTLGQMWVMRREMQDYWTEVVEIPVMDLHYDKLVVDQEAETRRLIEFLDLPWNEDCLQFHKSRRVAATISYDQVNQKMYTSSSGRWKNYEKHLGPLIDIVGDYL